MIDLFRKHTRSLTSPPEFAAEITPDDGTAFGHVSRALYVGSGGDLAVRTLGGDAVTFRAVPSGTLIPLRASHVLATGTTASAIVGLW